MLQARGHVAPQSTPGSRPLRRPSSHVAMAQEPPTQARLSQSRSEAQAVPGGASSISQPTSWDSALQTPSLGGAPEPSSEPPALAVGFSGRASSSGSYGSLVRVQPATDEKSVSPTAKQRNMRRADMAVSSDKTSSPSRQGVKVKCGAGSPGAAQDLADNPTAYSIHRAARKRDRRSPNRPFRAHLSLSFAPAFLSSLFSSRPSPASEARQVEQICKTNK
jgi:hypothetical protein